MGRTNIRTRKSIGEKREGFSHKETVKGKEKVKVKMKIIAK